MKVEVEIEGRLAIPIRAVPYVNGWKYLNPVNLTALLAGKHESKIPLTAYTLHSSGEYDPISSDQWNRIASKVKAMRWVYAAPVNTFPLSEEITYLDRANKPESDQIKAIPKTTFLWKNDLEHALTLFGEKEKGMKELTENGEDKDAEAAYLTDNPLIPPDLESVCMEGFEDIQRQNSQKELFPRERDNLLQTIGVLTQLLVKAQRGPKLGSCEKPNIRQIAVKIVQYLSDNDLSPIGLSDRTLRDRIKDALSLLKTNKQLLQATANEIWQLSVYLPSEPYNTYALLENYLAQIRPSLRNMPITTDSSRQNRN